MKTFVADIIPKIQRYSQKLDNLTLLTNQHWVVLDELGQSKTVYIFRQTNELLISTNGKVEKAKWEYLGQNSILIDLKDQSYLFRHGFFDENVLALKIDSKEEYAVLINESKYQGELNSISAVLDFLKKNYIVNPVLTNKQCGQAETKIIDVKYQRDGYTFKMGSFKEFGVRLSSGQIFNVYQKVSNGKYFIYANNEIVLFPDKETCLKYIEGQIR
jgi:hypothetical protein